VGITWWKLIFLCENSTRFFSDPSDQLSWSSETQRVLSFLTEHLPSITKLENKTAFIWEIGEILDLKRDILHSNRLSDSRGSRRQN
jgi:hypothetical protein